MIRAVIFDLDDTLYDYHTLHKEAFKRVQELVVERLGVSGEQSEEAFRRARIATKENLGETAASHSRMLYFQKTLEYLDIRPLYLALDMYEIYWGVFLNKMTLYPGVDKLMDALHDKYVRVAICTDLLAQIQHRKLRALRLTDDVDCLVTSEEAGAEKPSPKIFQMCLDKLRLYPKEVCFVGDSFEKDVKGAAAAGMRAIWFNPEKQEPPAGSEDVVFETVASHEELYALLAPTLSLPPIEEKKGEA
ncbi:MAG: HAD family hydrolase [Lachnospiraceae bacterium]|nr:HAD family hydrolase [Lachnospiraceae bacterium]